MDRVSDFHLDSTKPVLMDVGLNKPPQKGAPDAAQKVKKVPAKVLDFGPSPYVKDGLLEDANGKDYLNACKVKPAADEPEEHLQAPKPVEVEQTFKTFELLKSKVPFDSSKHTVVVVDEFKASTYAPNGAKNPGLSHGEISAKAAEQAGLNVIRLHMTTNDHLPTVLAEVDKEITAGALPVKSGDAINMSFGHHWTLAETRCILGMPSLTPKSYASQRPEIMKRIQESAAGTRPVRAAADGKWLTVIAATHKEVASLQDKGITMVVSAGNEGPNQFNLDFINASEQLGAGNNKGHAFPYSASNSLSKIYPSSFELTYDAGKKAYLLGKSEVSFPEADFGGAPNPKTCVRANSDGEGDEFKRGRKTALKDCPVAVVEGTSFSNVEFWNDFNKLDHK